jgi:cytochrome c oxidase subunit 2
MCFSCHSADGSPMVGPTLKGLYGTKKTVVDAKGKESELSVDEAYLADSITKPMEAITKGYPPAMPPNSMTADEVRQVVDFIKTLK